MQENRETKRTTSPTGGKSVLVIGLDPNLLDFSDPGLAAFPGMTAAKVAAGISAQIERLNALGYDAQDCMVDFGDTAEAVVLARLKQKQFDCIAIGAGIRTIPSQFILFEKLINVAHEHAPQARLCFNTNPMDTAEAVQRWI